MIVLDVKGGMVFAHGLDEDVTVEIHDYDIDGTTDDDLEVDEDGARFHRYWA